LTPPMLSYAQNAEDVVLRRVFGAVDEGFYVDVGASDPVDDSVTFHFYERGWRGVNVEPDLHDYQRLVAARTRDANLNAAVGEGGGRITFYPSTVRGQGTVKAELAAGRGDGSAFEVAQVSLGRIFEEHWPPDGVEFVKIDVEGSEAEVVASADWGRWRPRVVVVEAVDSTGAPTHETWESSLLAGGYKFALFDGINRFYCREEDEQTLLPRLSAPANTLDNWRPVREVAIQDGLRMRLEQAAEAHEGRQRALADERSAHAETRLALADERSAHTETRRALESIYDSTSWRMTAPMRDASRLAKLVGWGRVRGGARTDQR
jgi:FkbM family methyltransferase